MIKLKNKIISFITNNAGLTLIIMLCITFSVGPRISQDATGIMFLVTYVGLLIYSTRSLANLLYGEELIEEQRKELSKEQLEVIKASEEKGQQLREESFARAQEKCIKEEQEYKEKYKERDEALIVEYEKNFDKSFITIRNCRFKFELFSFNMTIQAKQIHLTPVIKSVDNTFNIIMHEIKLPDFPRITKKQDLINGISRWYSSPASYDSIQHAIDMFNLVKNDFEEEQYVEGLRKDYEFRKSKTEYSYFSITEPETIYLNESDWNQRNY